VDDIPMNLFLSIINTVNERLREADGQGMVEYALILVLIAIVVIVLLILIGNQISNAFSNISAAMGS
jgi:pilus assembly protein Flp/PilA